MSHRRNDDRNSSDDPPMSRLFIICNKANTEEDFREAFEKFGDIEEIYSVKDRNTGDNKGIFYIKYTKTSQAARALEEMNGKTIGPSGSRPLKVLVASSRNQGSGRMENEQEKYVRLFVIVPKNMTEEELREEFEKYGEIDSVTMIRDKVTRECKGFAYIKYFKFTQAANAFENCGSKYRAVFAEPRGSSNTRQSNNTSDRNSRYDDHMMNSFGGSSSIGSRNRSLSNEYANFMNSAIYPNDGNRGSSGGGSGGVGGGNGSSGGGGGGGSSGSSGEVQLNIICCSSINQDQLWRLFDIIPGLDYCQISGECGRNSNMATAVYSNFEAAQYAREKLHGLEYPPGQRLIIKPLNETKPTTESLFPFDTSVVAGNGKDSFSSVPLPAPLPMANSNSQCAMRLFIVCVPKALPPKILSNIFCRFGDLIDVYMLQNKNCGYAKYANESSALKAIDVLHSAEVCGIKLKVMEAEEPRDPKRKRYEDD